MRSASATCSRASGRCARLRAPFGASITVDQRLQVEFLAERAVAGEGLQQRAGVGEAAGLDDDALEARHRAARAVGEERAQALLQIAAHRQQRQPLPSSTVASLDARNSALSMPISPYSLTTTAVLAPAGLSSSARIRVVLPAPRKPVTIDDRHARATRPPLRPAEPAGASCRRRGREPVRGVDSVVKSTRRSAPSARRRRRRCSARRAARRAAVLTSRSA